jgi:hypothetical protein
VPVHGVADTLADAVDLILQAPAPGQSGDHD